MRTLSVVGVVGLSFVTATCMLLATSATTGCSGDNIVAVDGGKADAAVDGAVEAGPTKPGVTGDKGRAVFVVDGVYAVKAFDETATSDAGVGDGGEADGGDGGVDAAVSAEPPTGPLDVTDRTAFLRSGDGITYLVEPAASELHVLYGKDPTRELTSIDVSANGLKPSLLQPTSDKVALAAAIDSNLVKVVDSDASKGSEVRTSIDLSEHLTVDDPDGTVDVAGSAFDPSSKLTYMLLQHVDRAEVGGEGPDHLGKCRAVTGTIVGVDAAQADQANISSEANPHVITLLGHHPQQIVLDAAGKRLFVVHRGCWGEPPANPGTGSTNGGGTTGGGTTGGGTTGGGTTGGGTTGGGTTGGSANVGAGVGTGESGSPAKLVRLGRGIEVIDLKSGTTRWAYQPKATNTDELTDMLWVDAAHVFVRAGGAWRTWSSAEPVLNSIVDSFPSAPSVTSDGKVIGLRARAGSNAVDLVSFDPHSKATTPLGTDVFNGQQVDLTKRASSVLLPWE